LLFNVEFDEGNVIEGYLVPDGFSEEPGILVSDGAEVLLELTCRGQRDAVRISGRHGTGLVGFRLDDSNVPDLAGRMELTIREAKSGLLIYRRGTRQWTRKRIVRLELQLVPLLGLDRSVQDHFQYAMSRAERFGLETTLQVFHLNNANSIYLAGRLQIRAFEQFMEKGFEVAAILTEPYFEMAERILLLKRFSSLPEIAFGPRDHMILAPAAERFAAIDLTSPKDIRSILKAIDPATARIIKAPLTRQLTTLLPDEEPTRHSVAVGLDIISRFAATGLRAHPETFTHPFAELLGIDPHSVDRPKQHRAVAELAQLLRDIPQAETLLEPDLMIYHFAHEAITSHMRTEPQPVDA
jgi:hypothetical protein